MYVRCHSKAIPAQYCEEQLPVNEEISLTPSRQFLYVLFQLLRHLKTNEGSGMIKLLDSFLIHTGGQNNNPDPR